MTPVLKIVKARVALEPMKPYTYEDVVFEGVFNMAPASCKLWPILSKEIQKKFPGETCAYGPMRVGSGDITELLTRVGRAFVGHDLHILYFPHGSGNPDVSLVCKDSLYSENNTQKIDQLFTTLFNTRADLKELYDQSRALAY